MLKKLRQKVKRILKMFDYIDTEIFNQIIPFLQQNTQDF